MKALLGTDLPEISEVTLLSLDELKEYGQNITPMFYFWPCYYYLRTPYEDDLIGVACEGAEDEPIEPYYDDMPPVGPSGTSLRPLLRLVGPILKDGRKVEPKDRVIIGNTTFTAISDTILLADQPAWYDIQENSCGYFDEQTNVYEDSLAKKRVDQWFIKEIKPYL